MEFLRRQHAEPMLSQPSADLPKINARLGMTAFAIIGLLGCAGPQVSTDRDRSVIAHISAASTASPPLSDVERLIEESAFRKVVVAAQHIFSMTKKMKALEKEVKKPGKEKDATLREGIAKCQQERELSALRAFKEISKAPPRCWPRLLRALRDLSNRNVKLAANTESSLEQFGDVAESDTCNEVRKFQKLMYRDQIQLIAVAVVRLDIKISTLTKELVKPLPHAKALHFKKLILKFQTERRQLIEVLESGKLFPAKPRPPAAWGKEFLELFEKTRQSEGGLPKVTSEGPKRIRFGKERGPEGAPKKTSPPIPPQPEAKPKPPNPKKKERKRSQNHPRFAFTDIPEGLETNMVLMMLYLYSTRPAHVDFNNKAQ